MAAASGAVAWRTSGRLPEPGRLSSRGASRGLGRGGGRGGRVRGRRGAGGDARSDGGRTARRPRLSRRRGGGHVSRHRRRARERNVHRGGGRRRAGGRPAARAARWAGPVGGLHPAPARRGFAVLAYESRGSPVEATGCRTRWARCAGCGEGRSGRSRGRERRRVDDRARGGVEGAQDGHRGRRALAAGVAGPLGSAGERPLSPARRAVHRRRARGAGLGGAAARRGALGAPGCPEPGHGIVLLGDPAIREAALSWLRDRLG